MSVTFTRSFCVELVTSPPVFSSGACANGMLYRASPASILCSGHHTNAVRRDQQPHCRGSHSLTPEARLSEYVTSFIHYTIQIEFVMSFSPRTYFRRI